LAVQELQAVATPTAGATPNALAQLAVQEPRTVATPTAGATPNALAQLAVQELQAVATPTAGATPNAQIGLNNSLQDSIRNSTNSGEHSRLAIEEK
jgi:hypothetical protein